MRIPRSTLTTSLVAALLCAACSGGSGGAIASLPVAVRSPAATAPAASPSAPAASPPAPSPSVAPTGACARAYAAAPSVVPTEPTQLAAVRVGRHAAADRVVFEFVGDVVPAFDVAPASSPFVSDASGLPIDVPGDAFLRIHFPFATGAGTYSGPGTFAGPGGPGGTLVSLVRTGDYEAVMTWVAGTSTVACVRVTTLASPTRVVLDISPYPGGAETGAGRAGSSSRPGRS